MGDVFFHHTNPHSLFLSLHYHVMLVRQFCNLKNDTHYFGILQYLFSSLSSTSHFLNRLQNFQFKCSFSQFFLFLPFLHFIFTHPSAILWYHWRPVIGSRMKKDQEKRLLFLVFAMPSPKTMRQRLLSVRNSEGESL